jgi:hypothetical protein
MEYTKKLVVQPFGFQLNLVLTDDIAESHNKRKKAIGPYGETINISALFVGHNVRPLAYVFLPVNPCISLVVHEIYHAIVHMLDFVGAKHDEEVVAYYLSFLVVGVCEFAAKVEEISTEVPKIVKNED